MQKYTNYRKYSTYLLDYPVYEINFYFYLDSIYLIKFIKIRICIKIRGLIMKQWWNRKYSIIRFSTINIST